MRLIKTRTSQNGNPLTLLGLPGELRNMIYDEPPYTLIRKRPHYQSSRIRRRDWRRCFQIIGPNLARVCRQLRQETTTYKPRILVLPFDVDLGVLLKLKGFSYFSKVHTIKITDKLAKRFRGFYSGNYRGKKVDGWKRKKLVRRTFPSVNRVMVKKVWHVLEDATIGALVTLFDKTHLRVDFNWDES